MNERRIENEFMMHIYIFILIAYVAMSRLIEGTVTYRLYLMPNLGNFMEKVTYLILHGCHSTALVSANCQYTERRIRRVLVALGYSVDSGGLVCD
jgi:hypothetical protein